MSNLQNHKDDIEIYPHMLGILEKLISFDTVSGNSNMALNDFVREMLTEAGHSCRFIFNSDKTKANLIATIGDMSQPALVLSAHTDVVPVAGQDWFHDPFQLRSSCGRLYGRGTTDMKGFVACCLAVLTTIPREQLIAPVILVLSYDEEVGCIGVRDVLPNFARKIGPAIGCVVGEPTGMQIVSGHKGKQNYRVTVHGHSKHASQSGTAVNAVEVAARLVVACADLNMELRKNGPWDDRFDINHSTINVGRIQGGLTANMIADSCEFEFELRAIPQQTCEEIANLIKEYAQGKLLPEMMRLSPEHASIDFALLSSTPALTPDIPDTLAALVAERTSISKCSKLVPFGTEAGLFQTIAGIPTIVCGPGEIIDAHTANESIEAEQLSHCLDMLTRLVSR